MKIKQRHKDNVVCTENNNIAFMGIISFLPVKTNFENLYDHA